MSIDMLVLPITDFDVLLGVNSLTKFRVVIDCPNRELSFDSGDPKLSYTLINPKPKRMPTMELWEKPLLATMSVDEVTMVMVTVVREYVDVFPDELLGLPLD